jgi:two-component system, OmpR family, sensor histidine kinase ChvG
MLSTRSMEPDTDSLGDDAPELGLRWSGGLSLTQRILAVNILPLLLLATSFFYLDAVRSRLIQERLLQARNETALVAFAIGEASPADMSATASRLGTMTGTRLRVFESSSARLIVDSWQGGKQNFNLTDPDKEPWQRHVASWLDDTIDLIVDAKSLAEFETADHASSDLRPGTKISVARDRTHIISVVQQIPGLGNRILVTDRNVRDIRRLTRAERSRLGMLIGVTTLLSVLLSLFLARTIVLPLNRLARAASQVRLGRAREVVVPRLPSRRDEIGLVARSLSDMNHALQLRIDSIEAFAADVAHELKNPLASMSSAVESLANVKDAKLAKQLQGIISDDVVRLDRLITDISELSRIDAQLARTRYEKVDVGQLIEGLLKARSARGLPSRAEIAFARPKKGSAVVRGDASRLARVVENLLDNAISFSPEKGVVRIAASRAVDQVIVSVEDDGPGIAQAQRDAIFNRFHSDRPDSEAFGKHSGLGLSIAKTVVEAHKGSIEVRSRDGKTGGWFVITLPALPR